MSVKPWMKVSMIACEVASWATLIYTLVLYYSDPSIVYLGLGISFTLLLMLGASIIHREISKAEPVVSPSSGRQGG